MTATGRALTVVILSIAGVLVGSAGSAGSASVSCLQPPPVSPAVFTGTVLSTESRGRIALVRTDDGRVVAVHGTPSPDAITTVDRSYEVGARYEFHPTNATEPFEDNICTATHRIPPQPTVPATSTVSPASAVPGPARPPGTGWMIAGAAALAGAGLLGFTLRRRHNTSGPRGRGRRRVRQSGRRVRHSRRAFP